MSKQKSHSEDSKKERRKKVVTIIVLIVLIVLLAILLYFLLGKDEQRNVVLNEDNVQDIIDQDPEDPTYYNVTMNSTWNFASGTAESDNAYVENAEMNENPVYFDIVRTDTGEKIYESSVLPVGSHLDKIKLDSDLPDGTYDCVVTYHLLDEDQKELSTVRVTLTINVGQ